MKRILSACLLAMLGTCLVSARDERTSPTTPNVQDAKIPNMMPLAKGTQWHGEVISAG